MNASLHANLLNVQKSSSTNIVRYLGYECYKDLYVMVMEYVEGESLRKVLGEIGNQSPMEIDKALDIVEQVCEGLAEMHKFHIFHRDIKPENILICKKDGVAKILDLGISRILTSGEYAMSTSGSPYYMPKEIILNKGGAFYSDIYSLGVTMYEMLTGELPFTGTTIYELQHNILNSVPKQPKEINPEINDKLNRIILKAIEKDPP
jgi:serine/threonine protein kinase